jgi:hypothetical protein
MLNYTGGLSYEQALIAMVHYLASQNKELTNLEMERRSLSVPSIILQVPDTETLEKALVVLREVGVK